MEEADAATIWYAGRSHRAAERFLDELGRAVKQISENPEIFPSFVFGTRRMALRKFPYVIVFRDSATAINIIAIAHGRRRPGYWRDRV